MNQVEQLQRWGAVHGAAREAERQAAQQGEAGQPLRDRAKRLREQADRLHAEIYGQIGNGAGREGPGSSKKR